MRRVVSPTPHYFHVGVVFRVRTSSSWSRGTCPIRPIWRPAVSCAHYRSVRGTHFARSASQARSGSHDHRPSIQFLCAVRAQLSRKSQRSGTGATKCIRHKMAKCRSRISSCLHTSSTLCPSHTSHLQASQPWTGLSPKSAFHPRSRFRSSRYHGKSSSAAFAIASQTSIDSSAPVDFLERPLRSP